MNKFAYVVICDLRASIAATSYRRKSIIYNVLKKILYVTC